MLGQSQYSRPCHPLAPQHLTIPMPVRPAFALILGTALSLSAVPTAHAADSTATTPQMRAHLRAHIPWQDTMARTPPRMRTDLDQLPAMRTMDAVIHWTEVQLWVHSGRIMFTVLGKSQDGFPPLFRIDDTGLSEITGLPGPALQALPLADGAWVQLAPRQMHWLPDNDPARREPVPQVSSLILQPGEGEHIWVVGRKQAYSYGADTTPVYQQDVSTLYMRDYVHGRLCDGDPALTERPCVSSDGTTQLVAGDVHAPVPGHVRLDPGKYDLAGGWDGATWQSVDAAGGPLHLSGAGLTSQGRPWVWTQTEASHTVWGQDGVLASFPAGELHDKAVVLSVSDASPSDTTVTVVSQNRLVTYAADGRIITQREITLAEYRDQVHPQSWRVPRMAGGWRMLGLEEDGLHLAIAASGPTGVAVIEVVWPPNG